MSRDVGKFRIVVLNAEGKRTGWAIGINSYWREGDSLVMEYNDDREMRMNIPKGGRFVVKSNAGWYGDTRDMEDWLDMYPSAYANGGVITAETIQTTKIRAEDINARWIPGLSVDVQKLRLNED